MLQAPSPGERCWQTWSVEFESGIPVYRQIMNHVLAAVAAGELKPGDQLPTVRWLHRHLNVNPNTVAKAYRELAHQGTLVAERGSGSFIRPGSQPARAPSARQRKARLNGLYRRLLAEAARSGLTENEILQYIKERPAREFST